MIALVFAVGTAARGSRRWIDVGSSRFQPSEFAKLLFVLSLAGFLAERPQRATEGRRRCAVALGAMPVLLVFLQPDLGTALVYLRRARRVLFVCRHAWRHLVVLGAVVVVVVVGVLWAGPAVGVDVLKGYQKDRLTCFTHPATCPVDARTTSSSRRPRSARAAPRAAAPNGGDPDNGSTSSPSTGPTSSSPSLAEQRGFVGAVLLLGLYLLVLWRGLRVVTVARDLFSAIVAGGIVVALLFQIFVNVGMTMGIAPITGIPLPFVSVGGSSMIANLAAIGVLLAIHARGRVSRRAAPALMALPIRLGVLRGLAKGDSGRRWAGRSWSGRSRAPAVLGEGARSRRRRGPCAPTKTRRVVPCSSVCSAASRGGSDELGLARARRARVPIIAVVTGPVSDEVTIPNVLATDVVRVAGGEGFPVAAIAKRKSPRRLGGDTPCARRACRRHAQRVVGPSPVAAFSGAQRDRRRGGVPPREPTCRRWL